MSRWRNLGLLICLTAVFLACTPDDAVPEGWFIVCNETPEPILVCTRPTGTFDIYSGGARGFVLPLELHEVWLYSEFWAGWRPAMIATWGTETRVTVNAVWPPTVSHAPPE